MAVSHKGAISFGLVHIPVSLYTATQDNSISFNQLHKENGQRIKYKKVVPGFDDDVTSDEIVKGYEYEKEKYIIFTEDDFEKIKTEKDKSIQILHFADINEIDSIYFEKSYFAVPDAGGDKAFELLRKAMLDENKVAVAKSVFGTKDNLLAILPTHDGIVIETLYYHDEIKPIPKTYNKQEANPAELNMAKMLINSMIKPFEPTLYHDEYQIKLKKAIEEKIDGKEIVIPQPENKVTVIDLMEALKASLEQVTK
ncbi:MAG: Ku protein [Clostridia bacterium]|nr:Ku protein [Clostridia bacterium]